MSEIDFRLQFDDPIKDARIPEDSTLAKLGIYVGSQCLTYNRLRRGTQLHNPPIWSMARLPALPIGSLRTG